MSLPSLSVYGEAPYAHALLRAQLKTDYGR